MKQIIMQSYKNDNILNEIRLHTSLSSTKAKQKTCSLCDKIFSSKQYLKQHVESIHEGKQSLKCSFCNYTYSVKGCLKGYIEAVHDGKNHSNVHFVITIVHKEKI